MTATTTKLLLKYLSLSNLVLSVALVVLLWRKRKWNDYKYFVLYLYSEILASCISIPILFFRKQFHISVKMGWRVYWGLDWSSYLVFSTLQALTLYAIYRLAMRPLPGLQKIGQIIFRWIAGVSFGLAVFFAIAPRAGTSDYWSLLVSQMHQGASILSLCLLFFVCLAIRPLGLTFRSPVFGVSLGLGITAATDMVEAAWFPTPAAHSLYSPLYLVGGSASFVALLLWITYFALPEPEQRMILLPTTSPFFHWNSISEALGDEPGFVAVSGFTPDMLSAAEIEELSRPPQPHAVLEDISYETDPDGASRDDVSLIL
jgi:hypothetical protein